MNYIIPVSTCLYKISQLTEEGKTLLSGGVSPNAEATSLMAIT